MSERKTLKWHKNYTGPDRVVSSVAFAKMLESLPPVSKHLTGFNQLDKAIGGFEVGELIVISGPTAMGKTLLCDSIVTNMNVEQKRSVFFTFEVTPSKFIENHKEPKTCVYLPLQHQASDLIWLQDRVQEAIEKYDVKAVFIDHLHYIIDMRSKQNMSMEIGATMRMLKRDIAIALNIPVFIVCHASKVPVGQVMTMDHLRDSSFVAQEADTVLLVGRRYDKDLFGKTITGSMLQGLALVTVAKARRTGTMGLKIKLKKDGHALIESLFEPEENSND
jgi:replicative DNA helicase